MNDYAALLFAVQANVFEDLRRARKIPRRVHEHVVND